MYRRTCSAMRLSRTLIVFCWLGSLARADDRFYVGPDSGLWNDPANWSATSGGAGGAGVPVAGDWARLDNATAANISTTLNLSYASPGLLNLYLDGTNGFFNTISQTDPTPFNMVVATEEIIGNIGRGHYVQSAGQHTTSALALAWEATAHGIYNLSGGTLSVTSTETVGNQGSGTFTQSGGLHSPSLGLYLANLTGSSGRYDLSGGTLALGSTSALLVGHSGAGEFNQTGGVLTVGLHTGTTVGNFAGSVGVFNQSGGSHTTKSLGLGSQAATGSLAAAKGTYTLGPGAVLRIEGEPATSEMGVGDSGEGTFNHNGGTVFVDNAITIGGSAGGIGRYFFNGGTLEDRGMVVGWNGLGEFTQTAGTHTVDENIVVGRFAGSTGTFNHSGGVTNVGGGLSTGEGNGVINISGGTVTTLAGVAAGSFATSTGIINLSGGFLSTNYIYNNGTFNHTGGTYSGTMVGNGVYNFTPPPGPFRAGDATVLSAASITIGDAGAGSVNWSGGDISMRAKSIIDNDGTFNIASNGTIDAAVAGDGELRNRATLRKANPGTTTLGANLKFVSDGGTIDVLDGLLAIDGSLSTTAASAFTKSGAGILQVSGLQNWGANSTLNVNGGSVRLQSNLDAQTLDTTVSTGAAISLENSRTIMKRLDLIGTASTKLTPDSTRVLVTEQLQIDSGNGATLDVTDNSMIVAYTGASPLATVASNVQSGYAGGAWTGSGIISSIADFVPGSFGVGYAEASSIFTTFPAVFAGEPVDSTSILLAYTLYGDSNLSGNVDSNDFNRLAISFGASAKFWQDGDFNYDGTVNSDDFNLLAVNFGLSAGADGVVDPSDWAALAAAVPEPGLATGALTAVLCLWRRRRHH